MRFLLLLLMFFDMHLFSATNKIRSKAELFSALASEKVEERMFAATELSKEGAKIVPDLIKLLKNTHEEKVKEAILGSFILMREEAVGALTEIEECLNDSSAKVRVNAAGALAVVPTKSKKVLAILEKMLNDSDPDGLDIRSNALAAITRSGIYSSGVKKQIGEFLTSGDVKLRKNATYAMIYVDMDVTRFKENLIKLSTDADPVTRAFALIALTRCQQNQSAIYEKIIQEYRLGDLTARKIFDMCSQGIFKSLNQSGQKIVFQNALAHENDLEVRNFLKGVLEIKI